MMANRSVTRRRNTVATYWSRVSVGAEDDCWEWQGGTFKKGYGRIQLDGKYQLAHRVAYAEANGPIPDGLVIDHTCRNRLCQNPKHLRAVTSNTNALENSVGHAAINKAKSFCIRGHPLSGPNLAMEGHMRRCRECHRETKRRYKARQRAA